MQSLVSVLEQITSRKFKGLYYPFQYVLNPLFSSIFEHAQLNGQNTSLVLKPNLCATQKKDGIVIRFQPRGVREVFLLPKLS